MANTLSNNQDVEPGTQPDRILCRDRAIDSSYIKNGHTEEDYAKEPWNHYEDALRSYSSLRFSDKVKFLDLLNNTDAENRIKHEIHRVGTAREKFFSQPNKQSLVNELNRTREQWKEKVTGEISQIQQERQKQLGKSIKKEYRDALKDWDQKHLNRLAPRNVGGNDVHSNRVRRFSRINSGRQQQQQQQPPSPIKHQPADRRGPPALSNSQYADSDLYYGFKAGAMYFQKDTDGNFMGIDSHNTKYQNTFPNQKIAMKEILDVPENNPLTQKCPENTIRYFHFPSNNMDWIQKAINKYYEGKDLKAQEDYKRLLAREHWEGQMHGSGSTDKIIRDQGAGAGDARRGGLVHARHMRTKCSLIPRARRPKYMRSASTSVIGASPKSLQKTNSIPVPLIEKNIALFLPYMHWETSSRRAQMVKVINDVTGMESKVNRPKNAWYQAINGMSRSNEQPLDAERCEKEKETVMTRRHLLGKYLMALARVSEEMDYEADERLLRENVNVDPPLHIRRTLDQYYFLTLASTSERDRDQVVYRRTKSFESTTRVVMVDQLWLWILDDNTIITSFPRRWGRNKPDPSGVHKSLRERLGPNTEAIKSIHHLAMIIIDQCSRVFFDRTKPLDQRPEVMDLFAESIGNVTEKTRIAYDHFWRSISLASQNKVPMVINPEGIVLKEAQDIAEELMIMKRVYTEQLKVARDFMRYLTHPHGRHAAISGEALLINKFISELRKTTTHNDDEEELEGLDIETRIDEESVHEAHNLIELLQARQAEIIDLEEAALRACGQLEGLLSLKQQQASIVEARAALERAQETYKQGRTIQAFTIVTIVFLPLGFIAAFFGMNNQEINGSPWMGLWEQIKWMFGGTGIVVFISVSVAFGAWFRALSSWLRAVLRLVFDVPWAHLSEWAKMSKMRDSWKNSIWNSKNLDRKRISMLAAIARKRREKEIEQMRLATWVYDRPLSSSASDTDGVDPVSKRVRFRMSHAPYDTTNGRADNNV